MANVTLFDQTGKQAGEVVLNDAIFGIEPNQSVVRLTNSSEGIDVTQAFASIRFDTCSKRPWESLQDR